MPIPAAVVRNQRSRVSDEHGSGQFGASRGKRSHDGLDILAPPKEMIFSPVEGKIIREAWPYKNDASLRSIVIEGRGAWIGYEFKIFYAEGIVCGGVVAGQHIGYAQDLTLKYEGISNHVHLEVRHGGQLVSPYEVFAQCF
jgi:hypothetical protein